MHKDKIKFTLEDMLSIKKAEKPSTQDWENFNTQLKSKMLMSVVEEKESHRFSTFAKIGAITVPILGVVLTFSLRPASVENVSLTNNVEIVKIPTAKSSYYSDTYFTNDVANTEYLQDTVYATSNTDIVYATNDLLDFKHLSF